MFRKLIPLGLVALAFAGIASTAQASSFMAEKYPATIEGSQTTTHVFSMETSLKVSCNTASFHGTLAEASSTMTIVPTYAECAAFGMASTVRFNGCAYLFHAGEEVAADVHAGTVDIVCPSEQSIEISAGTCEVSVPAQTGLGTSNVENNTNPMDAVATGSLTGVSYTKTKDGFLCPLDGTGTKTDGGYSGAATAIGTSGGAQVGIWVEG